jgi:hypothetical protein
LFHLRVISKNTKIDTLVDSGSKLNLISEQVVKNLILETRPHPRSYPLSWICDNAQLQVTKQCKLQFEITSSFSDEVELDVFPLNNCRMVLGSPYLYDKKAIFYKEQNKFHIFKDGIEFIVRSHQMKMNLTVVTIGNVKKLVNANIQDSSLQSIVGSKEDPLVDVVTIKKGKYVDGSFSFAYVYSFLFFSLLLISGVCLLATTMNGRVCEFKGMVNFLNNVVSIFIIIVMSQVLIIQA